MHTRPSALVERRRWASSSGGKDIGGVYNICLCIYMMCVHLVREYLCHGLSHVTYTICVSNLVQIVWYLCMYAGII